MISGERGEAILTSIAAHRMSANVDGDHITTSLIAACIAEAYRKGQTPREVALALWDGLPDDETWEGYVRDHVSEAIDEYERRLG